MSTYVFDLDGTICSQESSENYHKAVPITSVIEKMKLLSMRGHTIVIHTARGMKTYNENIVAIEAHLREMTVKWLDDNQVPYSRLLFGKPSGDFYVDDKGINAKDFSLVK